MVTKLAAFLRRRKLKGILKIFFKSGRLILKLILYKCNIEITYVALGEGVSTQIIVITATAGGLAGFTLSWFSVGASLVAPPLLISFLFLQNLTQQMLNNRAYEEFKSKMKELLKDNEIGESLRAVFLEDEGLTPSSGGLDMEPTDFDENTPLKLEFGEKNLKSGEEFEEFVRSRMKEELGLVENPTETELKEII